MSGTYTKLVQQEKTAETRKPGKIADGKKQVEEIAQEATQKSMRKATHVRDTSRDIARGSLRGKLREKPRELPTRDEIQEFSFRLRDELRVKVQAELPHRWQKELEDITRDLDVKKLELYRFIFGEFLEKVRRRKNK